MGFLKFLKREKKDALDELDLPPAPPQLEGAEPDFGAFGFEEKLPELPEFPEFGKKISAPEEMPEFDFPEEEKMQDMGKDEMPDFPSFPEMEEMPMPPIESVRAPFAIPKPALSMTPAVADIEQPAEEEPEIKQGTYPKMAGRLFSHEKRALREMPSAKTIYVSVDNFKATLGSINIVRSDLRKSEEALMKLESVKNAKDKSFDKLKSSLDDLQRKLIFVDKTLFKDEGEEK